MNQQIPFDNYKFNFKTTAKKVMKDIDLTGKIALVTGGYSGVGLETVKQFVSAGAQVIVPARRLDVAQTALTGLSNLTVLPMNLQNPVSIHDFADSVKSKFDKIDILVNSAGIMYVPLQRDERGIESHFATNHLGHFQLTMELLPLLKAAGNARVITVSSRAQQSTGLLADWNFTDESTYSPQIGYQQSKTANVLFSVKLDALGQKDGIRAFAVHPGMVLMTNIGREQFHVAPWQRTIADKFGFIHIPVFFQGLKAGFDRSKYRYFKTTRQGAATQVWAAVSPDLTDKGGLYCEDVNIARLMADSEADNFGGGVRQHSIDLKAADRLWEISVSSTGLDY
ncbi:SDR family NAD(P)-dependent oxidoreductase [Lactococcus protaetiae]|uniref:SDR family NAD(P)-dependent oxidoreductase n=1 Tax=Lactococcus protaetiae TaxID=2592653 RepID=A0A514Z905_9LACT|nr:SDR family NAD(P)-dependent oxidoreductase [Lactococcus protaetiae]QDK70997.1 SDR family NAD(P)-dependent oxidoreductase [Lactococcus protaetiae]